MGEGQEGGPHLHEQDLGRTIRDTGEREQPDFAILFFGSLLEFFFGREIFSNTIPNNSNTHLFSSGVPVLVPVRASPVPTSSVISKVLLVSLVRREGPGVAHSLVIEKKILPMALCAGLTQKNPVSSSPTGMFVRATCVCYDPPPMNTPVRVGETIEGSRTMRNRPYPVLKCSRATYIAKMYRAPCGGGAEKRNL